MNSRPVTPRGKRIKLSAVTNLAKQLFGLIGGNSEQRDRTARRTQQPGHQIHQRRLPCSVWTNQTGDAGRDLQVDAIHSEYLAVKLGDVVEDDQLIRRIIDLSHHLVSFNFPVTAAPGRQRRPRNSTAHEAQSGGSIRSTSRMTLPSKSLI